jgi:hypothetical protein
VTPDILTPAASDEIATEVARLVRERYVLPEEGAAIADRIGRRLAAGDYAAIDDPALLASALTDDLQSVNGDRHMRVIHTEEPVVDLADPEAELAMWEQKANRDAGGMARVEILPDGIGLLELRPIIYPAVLSGDRISAAMTLLAHTDALIIDVRECLGGSPDAVALICSHLFDDEPVLLNTMLDRSGAEPVQSWTQAWVPGRRFGLDKPVAILTSGTTFSGGEELTYDLQQAGRATVIGAQTGGGANPRQGFRVHPHLEATVPVAQPRNPVSGTNWELVGITPDIAVPAADALERALEFLREQLASSR